jgi:hypothetical protein
MRAGIIVRGLHDPSAFSHHGHNEARCETNAGITHAEAARPWKEKLADTPAVGKVFEKKFL